MKILIFGASGSGTTTLANSIANQTDFVHLDVDHYYWKQTIPPFQEKIPLDERNENIKTDFKKHKNAIISGSMVSWGKEWETAFDLVVFIRLENSERIHRLEKREIKRYGEKLVSNSKTQQDSKAFLEWANQYENPDFNGRSLKIHNNWMDLLGCEVLKIDGALGLIEKTKKVVLKINSNSN